MLQVASRKTLSPHRRCESCANEERLLAPRGCEARGMRHIVHEFAGGVKVALPVRWEVAKLVRAIMCV